MLKSIYRRAANVRHKVSLGRADLARALANAVTHVRAWWAHPDEDASRTSAAVVAGVVAPLVAAEAVDLKSLLPDEKRLFLRVLSAMEGDEEGGRFAARVVNLHGALRERLGDYDSTISILEMVLQQARNIVDQAIVVAMYYEVGDKDSLGAAAWLLDYAIFVLPMLRIAAEKARHGIVRKAWPYPASIAAPLVDMVENSVLKGRRAWDDKADMTVIRAIARRGVEALAALDRSGAAPEEIWDMYVRLAAARMREQQSYEWEE